MGNKFKKKWAKEWDNETIISQAVSLGMQYMAQRISTEDLKYNKKILTNAIKKKSKCCKAEVTTRLEEEKRLNNYSTNYYICKECLKPCDVIYKI